MKFSVVIPAHNEEEVISSTLIELGLALDGKFDYEIIVVNDHCYDGTVAKVEELIKENKKIRLVRNEKRGGFGMAIQANRFQKVRAVVCKSVSDVKQARQHNDMNVLCIGADVTNFNTAKAMCKAFFTTKFLKGRHTRRVKKLYENKATN